MKQKIKFDKTTKIVTAIVLLIPFAILITPIVLLKQASIIPLLTSLFLIITFLITWLLHPTSYEITTEHLLIHRPFSPIRIAYSSIIKIENTESGYSVRLFGSGGFFGYFGLFSSKKLGSHVRYTGNNENLVFIKTSKKKYLLSIHDELFYNELINRSKITEKQQTLK